MAKKPDKMHEMGMRMSEWLSRNDLVPFWGEGGTVQLDYRLLSEALSVPVGAGDSVQTGRFASSLDLWVAWEFRHAGFDGVWPRINEPRVIDPEVVRALSTIGKTQEELANSVLDRIGTVDANVMGSVYTKQIDVGMSSWLHGPELLVSTKTMSGSFGKNLANRFEEAYGDVKNLRARYPRAAHGFLFMVNSSIVEERSAFAKAVHMLHQLSQSGDVYDAVCLLLADWTDGDASSVCVPSDFQRLVPAELSAENFFMSLSTIVLRESSLDMHGPARSLRENAGGIDI